MSHPLQNQLFILHLNAQSSVRTVAMVKKFVVVHQANTVTGRDGHGLVLEENQTELFSKFIIIEPNCLSSKLLVMVQFLLVQFSFAVRFDFLVFLPIASNKCVNIW
jgi:hypothetical protein